MENKLEDGKDEWEWGTMAHNFGVHMLDEDGWVGNGDDRGGRGRQIGHFFQR